MKNKIIDKYLKEIDFLKNDVNIREINQHFAFGTMNEWLSAWHNAMEQCINNIKEEIK